MTGPLEMIAGDAPVCVDGVCWPVEPNGAANLVDPAPVETVTGDMGTEQTPPTD